MRETAPVPPGPVGMLLHIPPCVGVALADDADTGTKLGGEGAGAGMTLDADEAGEATTLAGDEADAAATLDAGETGRGTHSNE
jgi:hypothetical protein